MIYQCYYEPHQEPLLFKTPVYCGFGLEPEVNPHITKNCPELEDPSVRLALTEYGAMLYLWRNPPQDSDDWIGFTSYRQLAKTPFVFHSGGQISRVLWMRDIVGWGAYNVGECRAGDSKGAAAQAEHCHPGIITFFQELAAAFDFEIPPRFLQTDGSCAPITG